MSSSGNTPSAEYPVRLYFSGHEQTLPSHACGPGVWPHYLLHYVLSGCGRFQSGGKTWRLSAGDGFLIIPGIVSAYTADSVSPWEYCWIGFDGRDAAQILTSCGLTADSPVFHCSDAGNIPASADAGEGFLCSPHRSPLPVSAVSCLLSVNDALHSEPGNPYLHLSLLYRFFSLLSPEAGNAGKNSSAYLQQALDYFHHNYAYDIKIQDAARHVGIDRTYLYKLFCRELGTSPQQYLIRYRLSMARRLLSSTGLHISEIANSCGFADSASFCRHFRAQFSITPAQFRREPGTTPVSRIIRDEKDFS